MNSFFKNTSDLLNKHYSSIPPIHYLVLFIGLSCLLEYIDDLLFFFINERYTHFICSIICLFIIARAFIVGIDKWFGFVFITIGCIVFLDFRLSANHVFFALWLLAPISIYPSMITSNHYADYVRRSLGLVMIVAATQKLISGNFLNGEFLKYLAHDTADPNDQILASFCFGQPILECDPLVFLSILSIVWQYVIGVMLLINYRHIIAFLMELSFVLFVGFITDEMNFQTINIAALLIAFQISARPYMFVCLIGLLVIDHFQVENILRLVW